MEELSVKVSDSEETGRNMFEASWDLSGHRWSGRQ